MPETDTPEQEHPEDPENNEEQEPEEHPVYWLYDTETLFDIARRTAGLIIGMSVVAVAMSFGMFYVQQERFLEVFISATLGWSGYLAAHYAATGKFIHQRQEQHVLPQSSRKILGGISGVLILTAGIAIWAISLQQGDRLTSVLGALIFLAGYTIAHYEFTGDLL